MSSIVWLASYPKSGNTWVRILLANYLSGAQEPVDINHLLVSSMASARGPFDQCCGIEASALDESLVDRLRPAVYRRLAADSSDDLFMKVHDAWSETVPGQPMFPADVTRAVVYVVRNPLDVAVSAAAHWDVEPDQVVEWMCDPDYCYNAAATRLPDQLRQFLGSWSDHARSWLDRSALPSHLVRYEDLHVDPGARADRSTRQLRTVLRSRAGAHRGGLLGLPRTAAPGRSPGLSRASAHVP